MSEEAVKTFHLGGTMVTAAEILTRLTALR